MSQVTVQPSRFDGGPKSWTNDSTENPIVASSLTDKVSGLHQSASDVNLPITGSTDSLPPGAGLKRVMSETILPYVEVVAKDGMDEHTQLQRPTERRRSVLTKPPKLAVSKYAIPELPLDADIAELPKVHTIGAKSKSSSSLSNLARRSSWIIGSRSPSPSNRKTQSVSKPEKVVTSKKSILKQESVESLPSTGSRASNTTKVRRPLSAIFKSQAENPTIPPIPKSFSTDRLPTIKSPRDIPDLPTPRVRDRYQVSAPPDIIRKKDELWGNFRTLDGEYSKFITKPGTLKAGIIRSSLLPFLKQYSDHPSNKSLRAEDLDRRVNIFNKWWTGLLEMLNGRNGQSVSPSDRPAVLDGLTGIMTRPEWRLSMSAISSRRPNPKSQSSSSLDSTGSDFLAESVLHNVKSLFIQNLLSQMAFVVDRMSLRSVPASIVAFCGKAIAYAFFFCPGVADILVRLWNLPQATLRRILDEAKIPRNSNLRDVSETTDKQFPAHLRHLSFKSLPSLMKSLRAKCPHFMSLNYIPWYGPWIGRWNGRDSDLFFGFAKQYHILTCEILPDATNDERICAPGAVLVYGQLLAVMDATIHRSSNSTQEPSVISFDDILGADASATPLPVRAPNTARLMAENRLIMLLREFLSDSPLITPTARNSFAALFGDLLKAATKRTSLNDHDSCFILCDFLEESMFILARFYRGSEDPAAFLDWDFWFSVLKRLGESNNTMTEVRLYAFVYSLWGFITKDKNKKRDICLHWLLEENFVYRQFNHWCPMV
jgi:hypothetical protein